MADEPFLWSATTATGHSYRWQWTDAGTGGWDWCFVSVHDTPSGFAPLGDVPVRYIPSGSDIVAGKFTPMYTFRSSSFKLEPATARIVSVRKNRPDVAVPCTDYRQIHYLNFSNKATIWRPSHPNSDYVPMGDVVRSGTGKPPIGMYYLVHKKYLYDNGATATRFWDADGTDLRATVLGSHLFGHGRSHRYSFRRDSDVRACCERGAGSCADWGKGSDNCDILMQRMCKGIDTKVNGSCINWCSYDPENCAKMIESDCKADADYIGLGRCAEWCVRFPEQCRRLRLAIHQSATPKDCQNLLRQHTTTYNTSNSLPLIMKEPSALTYNELYCDADPNPLYLPNVGDGDWRYVDDFSTVNNLNRYGYGSLRIDNANRTALQQALKIDLTKAKAVWIPPHVIAEIAPGSYTGGAALQGHGLLFYNHLDSTKRTIAAKGQFRGSHGYYPDLDLISRNADFLDPSVVSTHTSSGTPVPGAGKIGTVILHRVKPWGQQYLECLYGLVSRTTDARSCGNLWNLAISRSDLKNQIANEFRAFCMQNGVIRVECYGPALLHTEDIILQQINKLKFMPPDYVNLLARIEPHFILISKLDYKLDYTPQLNEARLAKESVDTLHAKLVKEFQIADVMYKALLQVIGVRGTQQRLFGTKQLGDVYSANKTLVPVHRNMYGFPKNTAIEDRVAGAFANCKRIYDDCVAMRSRLLDLYTKIFIHNEEIIVLRIAAQAAEEAARLARIEAEQKALAEAEAQRIETARLAAEAAARIEAERQKEEEERLKRLEEERLAFEESERRRLAAEAEAQRLLEKAAEDARLAELENERLRLQAIEEARLAAERTRLAEEEAARQRELDRLRAEAEAEALRLQYEAELAEKKRRDEEELERIRIAAELEIRRKEQEVLAIIMSLLNAAYTDASLVPSDLTAEILIEKYSNNLEELKEYFIKIDEEYLKSDDLSERIFKLKQERSDVQSKLAPEGFLSRQSRNTPFSRIFNKRLRKEGLTVSSDDNQEAVKLGEILEAINKEIFVLELNMAIMMSNRILQMNQIEQLGNSYVNFIERLKTMTDSRTAFYFVEQLEEIKIEKSLLLVRIKDLTNTVKEFENYILAIKSVGYLDLLPTADNFLEKNIRDLSEAKLGIPNLDREISILQQLTLIGNVQPNNVVLQELERKKQQVIDARQQAVDEFQQVISALQTEQEKIVSQYSEETQQAYDAYKEQLRLNLEKEEAERQAREQAIIDELARQEAEILARQEAERLEFIRIQEEIERAKREAEEESRRIAANLEAARIQAEEAAAKLEEEARLAYEAHMKELAEAQKLIEDQQQKVIDTIEENQKQMEEIKEEEKRLLEDLKENTETIIDAKIDEIDERLGQVGDGAVDSGAVDAEREKILQELLDEKEALEEAKLQLEAELEREKAALDEEQRKKNQAIDLIKSLTRASGKLYHIASDQLIPLYDANGNHAEADSNGHHPVPLYLNGVLYTGLVFDENKVLATPAVESSSMLIYIILFIVLIFAGIYIYNVLSRPNQSQIQTQSLDTSVSSVQT